MPDFLQGLFHDRPDFGEEKTFEGRVVLGHILGAVDLERLSVDPGEVLFSSQREAYGDGTIEPVGVFAVVGIGVVRQNDSAVSRREVRPRLGCHRDRDNQTGSGAECGGVLLLQMQVFSFAVPPDLSMPS